MMHPCKAFNTPHSACLQDLKIKIAFLMNFGAAANETIPDKLHQRRLESIFYS